MDYNTISGSAAQADRDTLVGPPLHRVHERVRNNVNMVRDIAARLRQHADIVHGECPENSAKDGPRPAPMGVLGGIDEALDDLDAAICELLTQAERNANLV